MKILKILLKYWHICVAAFVISILAGFFYYKSFNNPHVAITSIYLDVNQKVINSLANPDAKKSTLLNQSTLLLSSDNLKTKLRNDVISCGYKADSVNVSTINIKVDPKQNLVLIKIQSPTQEISNALMENFIANAEWQLNKYINDADIYIPSELASISDDYYVKATQWGNTSFNFTNIVSKSKLILISLFPIITALCVVFILHHFKDKIQSVNDLKEDFNIDCFESNSYEENINKVILHSENKTKILIIGNDANVNYNNIINPSKKVLFCNIDTEGDPFIGQIENTPSKNIKSIKLSGVKSNVSLLQSLKEKIELNTDIKLILYNVSNLDDTFAVLAENIDGAFVSVTKNKTCRRQLDTIIKTLSKADVSIKKFLFN